MNRIYLANNKGVVLVDKEDYQKLNKYHWYLVGKRNKYAATAVPNGRYRQKTLYMHNIILNREASRHTVVDHKNGNELDNQKANLRVCTNQQNAYNRKPNTNSKSKYKGVRWHGKSWQAAITINGVETHLGLYDNEIEAAQVYNDKAHKYFGEFARLNIIKETN